MSRTERLLELLQVLRRHRAPVAGATRGVFCGMGVCFDCLVVIDGEPSRRACVTFAREGMRVETQVGFGEAAS